MSKSQVDAMEETLVTYTLERDGKIIAGKSHMKATSQDPDVLGGELVFAGTRVPVKSLFDHLEGGRLHRGFP